MIENQLKTNDGRKVKAPIDQNPMLSFNIKNRTLSYYDKRFNPRNRDFKVKLDFLFKDGAPHLIKLQHYSVQTFKVVFQKDLK